MAVRTEVTLYHNFKGLSSLFEKNVCTELSKRPNDPRKNRQQYTKIHAPPRPSPLSPKGRGIKNSCRASSPQKGGGCKISTAPLSPKGRGIKNSCRASSPQKGGASKPPPPLLPERGGNQGSLPCVPAAEGQGSKIDRQEGNLHNPLP